MIIKTIKIENFMGTKERTVNLDEKFTVISGPNESGKSTIPNALMWILANKNLDGSASANVRPHGVDGRDVDHIVSAVEVDTVEGYTFRKEQRQKWTKKRGTDELVCGGLQNFYFINGVEKRETDFKAFVDGIVPQDALLFGISAKAFTALDTKKRREKLVPLAQVTDEEVIASNDDFKEIAPFLAVGTVAEIVTGCNRAIKGYASRRKEIPARIDELSRTVRTYKDGDSQEEVKHLEEEAVAVRGHIAAFDKEIEQLAKASADALAMEFDLNELKNRLLRDYRESKAAVERKGRAAQSEKAAVKESVKRFETELANGLESKEKALKSVMASKSNIAEIKGRKFSFKKYAPAEYVKPVEDVCPHCGRPYDTESVKIARERAGAEGLERYNREKTAAKEAFDTRMKTELSFEQRNLERFEAEYEKYTERCEGVENLVKEAKDHLAEVNKKVVDAVAEFNALVEPDVEADAEVIAMKAELDRLHGDVEKSKVLSDKRYEAQNILDNLWCNRESMVLRMSSVDRYNKQLESRKAELEAELANLSEKEMVETKKRDLVKAFELARIKAVTNKLNARFRYVKWQMFAEQVNGGYADVCIPTINGTSYDGLLNHGNKLLAELDIAEAFQNFYGVNIPLILDDAESVDAERIPQVDRQLIVLRRAGDKGSPLMVNTMMEGHG